MKPVVSTLRKLGIRSILYLHSMLIMARIKVEARRHPSHSNGATGGSRLYNQPEKSTFSLTQELESLSFLLNSHNIYNHFTTNTQASHSEDGEMNVETEAYNTAGASLPSVDDGSGSSSILTSSFPLQTLSECQVKGTSEWPHIQGSSGKDTQHQLLAAFLADFICFQPESKLLYSSG